MKNLVRVVSNHPESVHTTREWLQKAYGTILCPECNSISQSQFPRQIDIVLSKHPDHRITGGVWWTSVRTFHRDFINQICEHISDFVTGKCFDRDGMLIEEYVTCYSKNYIVVRGRAGSNYGICAQCNTVNSQGNAPHYIPRFYLTDSRIYMDSSCDMYLDEELSLELDFSSWPDAELDVIPVRDELADGVHLPIDPPSIRSKYPAAEIINTLSKEEVFRKVTEECQRRIKNSIKEKPEILEMLKKKLERFNDPKTGEITPK